MTELDQLIKTAFSTEGEAQTVNKFYAAFFRSQLYMPAYRQENAEEPFVPLYLHDAEKYFISIFDSAQRLSAWAGNEYSELDYVEIFGSDVIRCVGTEQVYLALNPGTPYYKEFSPEEIKRLKFMLAKVDQLKGAAK